MADWPEHVFQIDSVPFDWLFPRMRVIVHHGGMGTTGAALRAGSLRWWSLLQQTSPSGEDGSTS
jgi:hypothetical protein